MVGIEPAEGPGDGGPGADDGAIDIERQAGNPQLRQGVEDHVLVELDERAQGVLGEAPKPVAHGARARHARQPAEAADERIAGEIPQVLQAPGPEVQQREDQEAELRAGVITAQGGTRRAQPPSQIQAASVASQQLQTAVRGELLRDELDGQISLDHLPQGAYAQAHQRGLRESQSDVGTSALVIPGQAPLMHFRLRSIHILFSDWG